MFGRTVGIIALLSFCLVQPAAAQQPPGAAPEKTDHVAAVKESLQKSMAALRKYEWMETTLVSLNGEEKSRTQTNCSYDVVGKLQKIPLGAPAEDKKTHGLRGKARENKKEEISDATQEAVGLKVAFGAFPDGTVFPEKIQLDVASQQLAIAIENSGYKKMGP